MQFIEFPKVDLRVMGMELFQFPRMVKARQMFDSTHIENVNAHLLAQLDSCVVDPERFRAKRICITAGSRGIPDVVPLLRTIVGKLRQWGAEPFIVPAMGSHGGATAQGQRELLEGYGINESTTGAPILSSMETVHVGRLSDGTPLFCDRYAAESDGIIIFHKVKPHTDFRGKHESGLAKMMAIGLAKHQGASLFHLKGFASFPPRIEEACGIIMQSVPVIMGVAVVENAYGQICALEAMDHTRIMERDAALLEMAKGRMAKFKLPSIDVLIIDEIGKDISGNGHDPNITGRSNSPGFSDMAAIKKLFIRGLTRETHYNACGLAMADITTRRCLNSVDFEGTWTNVVTSTRLNGGAIPMYAENDKEALLLAMRTCADIELDPVKLKIVRIKNTLHMDEIELSESYISESETIKDIEICSTPYDMQFDDEGFLF